MSITTLTNLRDYLTSTLSTDDMRWLVDEMENYMHGSDDTLKPYTMEEVNAMLDEAEANYAAGKGIPDEEAWDEWEEDFARMEQKELEMTEAI